MFKTLVDDIKQNGFPYPHTKLSWVSWRSSVFARQYRRSSDGKRAYKL